MSRIVKVNRIVIPLFFSVFIFFGACKSIYKSRMEFPDNVIVEGRGVGKIWLGESRKSVISILGKPDYIVVNKSKTAKSFVHNKVIFQKEFKVIAADIFRNDKAGEIFMHPFYKYYYLYLERGLILYFDKYNRVNSMLIVTSKFDDFTPFKGKLYFANLNVDSGWQVAVKKCKKHYGGRNNVLFYETMGFIFYYRKDTRLIFSRDGNRLSFVAIFSPVIGGSSAPLFFSHSELFTKKKMAKLREVYGKDYIRPLHESRRYHLSDSDSKW